MRQTVGVPHTEEIDSLDSLSQSDMSEDNEFRRTDLMWRNRNRGMSLENTKACDEIIRQFLTVDFNNSMLLPKTDDEMCVNLSEV